MMTVTINGNEVTIPEGMTMTVTPEGSMTLTPVTGTSSRKTGSKSRKGRSKKAAPKEPKVTMVNQRSLDRLNKAAGTKFRKAVCFVEAVRDGEAVLPEGFAFGPKYEAYLASGQSRKEFFGN